MGGDRVYRARVPLAGFEGLANRHALVFVVPAGGSANGQTKCLSCFDFLPVDPTSPTTLARMLLNLEVQGETRHREMSLAGGRRRESWVFQGEAPDCVNRAKEYSRGYDVGISLYGNSCETYADALVRHLLG